MTFGHSSWRNDCNSFTKYLSLYLKMIHQNIRLIKIYGSMYGLCLYHFIYLLTSMLGVDVNYLIIYLFIDVLLVMCPLYSWMSPSKILDHFLFQSLLYKCILLRSIFTYNKLYKNYYMRDTSITIVSWLLMSSGLVRPYLLLCLILF